MASTVTWDGLRDLAGFRTQNGCAISLYLDLDARVPHRGRRDDAGQRADRRDRAFRRGATPGARTQPEGRAPERRAAAAGLLRAGLRARRGPRARGLLRGARQPLAVAAAQLDGAGRGQGRGTLYLAPLVSLVGRGEGALVVVVSRERGDLYRLRAGRLEELVEHYDETPGRHDQGGWSQSRYQRHIDKLVQDHLKEVAELLDRQSAG